MNKYLSFLLISFSLSCQTPQEVKHTDASPLNIVHYEPTNEAIINPERGFLTHQDQKSDADKLTAEKVKNYRQQGISLILTIYSALSATLTLRGISAPYTPEYESGT